MKFKTLFFMIGFLASLGIVSMLIYFLHLFPEMNWLLIIGMLSIVAGILLVFLLFAHKKTTFSNKKYLFYAIVFNPGLVQIFAGILMLTMKDFNYIFLLSGAGMILSFIIGLLMLMMRDFLEKNGTDQNAVHEK